MHLDMPCIIVGKYRIARSFEELSSNHGGALMGIVKVNTEEERTRDTFIFLVSILYSTLI